MMITTPPAEPVVYLVLRDEILFFHFHPVICRKSFLFQEQIIKLMTLGLTESEAEEQIVNGFLK